MGDPKIPDGTGIAVLEGERRLPVYFLLDTSEAMTGAPIEAALRVIEQFRLEVEGDAFAFQTVWVGVITFGGRAQFATNGLVPISQLAVPPLTADGQNLLGEALQLLVQSLDKDIRSPARGGPEGDWRPLVFILLGSEPVDDWREPREQILNRERKRICKLVTLGCGPYINQQNIRDIAVGETLNMDNSDVSFKALFEWISTTTSDEGSLVNAQEDRGVSITATPPVIDLGCLIPGVSPRTTVRIGGGPARATTDSQRIVVTPSEIREEPTEVEVTVRDGADGELIWDTLHIRGDSGELDVPVICMWDEALSRSFKQSSRRATSRKVAHPAEPEEQIGATDEYPIEAMDNTAPAQSFPVTEPRVASPIERIYTGRSCPYCGRNLHYDSDGRTWLQCSKCKGARRLVSVPRRIACETKLGIKNDGKKIMRDLWEVIIGRQNWNLK